MANDDLWPPTTKLRTAAANSSWFGGGRLTRGAESTRSSVAYLDAALVVTNSKRDARQGRRPERPVRTAETLAVGQECTSGGGRLLLGTYRCVSHHVVDGRVGCIV
eukprot:scaffold4493_cov390-Prasinococcus_capsulatus_cf.AAC.16